MTIVTIHEAKTHFSRLVELAANGEEVVITKAGKPTVKLVPIILSKPKRKPGRLKGKIKMASDLVISMILFQKHCRLGWKAQKMHSQ
jgi:prevent-host-death family protein